MSKKLLNGVMKEIEERFNLHCMVPSGSPELVYRKTKRKMLSIVREVIVYEKQRKKPHHFWNRFFKQTMKDVYKGKD